MIKLIDHVPELMNSLPFPVGRFQSEGGEHAYYEHNTFYTNHTTRHGGRGNPDPILSLFQANWNRISCEIMDFTLSDKEYVRDVGNKFVAYCSSHTAAAVIQRCYRGYRVKKKLKDIGWVSKPMSGQHNKSNRAVKRKLQEKTLNVEDSHNPIKGVRFVLHGSVPAFDKKKMTQADLKKEIQSRGGRVKTTIPYRQKGISNKKYTVLTTQECLEKKRFRLL